MSSSTSTPISSSYIWPASISVVFMLSDVSCLTLSPVSMQVKKSLFSCRRWILWAPRRKNWPACVRSMPNWWAPPPPNYLLCVYWRINLIKTMKHDSYGVMKHLSQSVFGPFLHGSWKSTATPRNRCERCRRSRTSWSRTRTTSGTSTARPSWLAASWRVCAESCRDTTVHSRCKLPPAWLIGNQTLVPLRL